MKAIFYKLVSIENENTWWKKEFEITSFLQFVDLCEEINFTRKTQRFCYLDNIKGTDDRLVVEHCRTYINECGYADIRSLVEKMYQIGEVEREVYLKYKTGWLYKTLRVCTKIKKQFIEFGKDGWGFYSDLFYAIRGMLRV